MSVGKINFELQRTADWRNRVSERHPEDIRNATAAELCQKLALQDVSDALLEKLQSIDDAYAHECESFMSVPSDFRDPMDVSWSDVLSDIGFRFMPANVDEVASRLIEASRDAVAELIEIRDRDVESESASTHEPTPTPEPTSTPDGSRRRVIRHGQHIVKVESEWQDNNHWLK